MKPFPNCRQLDTMDCGPACLQMISKYYGRNFTLPLLRERSMLTRSGVSMLGISDAAESLGFRSNGLKLTFEQLCDKSLLPAILHWNQKHFVVCYKIRKLRNSYEIKISDPAGEKYSLTKEEFLKCWISSAFHNKQVGSALILKPTPEFYHNQEDSLIDKRGLLYFLNYIKPYRSQILQLLAGMFLGSFLSLVLPFLTQSMVDEGIGKANLSFITLVLIAQLIVFTVQLLTEFIRNWIVLNVNTRVSISMISDFLAKLMRLPINYFEVKNVGDILQRIRDNDRIKSFLTGQALITLFSFANFIIFTIVLGYYSRSILSVFIFGNGLYVLWVLLFMKYRKKLDIKRFTLASAEQNNLVQLVTGMQEIKLNNCEKQQRWKWERLQVRLFKISVKGLSLSQAQQIGSVFFSQVTSLIISFIAAKSVVEGAITIGMMMSVSYIIGQLSIPISQIIGFVQSAQDAKISLERLNEILEKDDEEQSIDFMVNEMPPCKSIHLENIYFGYPAADTNYILKGINLKIPENKVTAIVGASGSGKTTLMKLLLAFYPPDKGSIKIGNVLVDSINPHVWRSAIVRCSSYPGHKTCLN